MRRGYEAAARSSQDNSNGSQDNANGSGNMNGDKPNYGGWPGPWGPMAFPMEQWVSAVRAWTDMLSAFVPGGWPGAVPGAWQQPWNMGGMNPPYSAGTTAPALSVRVSSHRPAEVAASLAPGAETMPLVADVPHLRGLSVSREDGKLCVCLQVASDQPAGVYQGAFRSQGNEVGSLIVTITEPPETST